jgi:hypothetical protein
VPYPALRTDTEDAEEFRDQMDGLFTELREEPVHLVSEFDGGGAEG